jgi:hypothetical protein
MLKAKALTLQVFERLPWPINPQTPYGGTPDGSLPIEYQIVLDPLNQSFFFNSSFRCLIFSNIQSQVTTSRSDCALKLY